MPKAALLVFVGQTVACAAAPAPPSTPKVPVPVEIIYEPAPPELPAAAATSPRPEGPPGDRDGDGILDRGDGCPDIPGVRSAIAGASGCPVGPVLRGGCKGPLHELLAFQPDSAVVRGTADRLAKQIAAALVQRDAITLVGIEGFANPREQNPWAVSGERARAIRDALVAAGVHPSRLRLGPRHAESPPERCDSCECEEAAGRVVEVTVLARTDGEPVGFFSTDKRRAKPGARLASLFCSLICRYATVGDRRSLRDARPRRSPPGTP